MKIEVCEPYKYLTIPILHSGRLAKDNYNRRTVEREHCRYAAVLPQSREHDNLYIKGSGPAGLL